MSTKVSLIVIGTLGPVKNKLGQYLDEIRVTTQIGLIHKSTLNHYEYFLKGSGYIRKPAGSKYQTIICNA